MRSPLEWLVVALLAAWFGVTVVYQIFLRRLIPLTARWDVFRVVPSWHLYTDLPKALRLCYRDRDADGQAGEWREVSLPYSRRPSHALFNPELFASDATVSQLEFLCEAVQQAQPLSPERLRQTVGWQGAWLRVACEPRAVGMTERQFEVRQQTLAPGAPEERVYASEFLPLPPMKGYA